MGIKRTAVVALVGVALSESAFAQSSVTLSGKIDDGLTYVMNEGGHNNLKIDSGVLFPNLWILSGHEDLGAGNQAVFKLSSVYNSNNGQLLGAQNAIFGHQAYVGVQTPYGTVTLGNQFDLTAEFFAPLNVSASGSGYAIHQGDFDRTNNDRLKNSIKYMSPTWGGFQFGAMYGFSNVAGSFHDGSSWSAGAQYSNGPLTLVTSYTYLATPTLDPYAQIGVHTFFGQPVASGSGDNVTDLAPSFQIRSLGTLGIGGSYAIKDVTLYANYTNTVLKYQDETSVMNVFEGGATWQVTHALQLVGGYQHTGFEGHAWNQVTAAALYALSKRTQVYVSSDYLKASAGVDAVIGASFEPAPTGRQADIRVGIAHTF